MGIFMKWLEVAFLGIALILAATILSTAADDETVPKLIVQGDGEVSVDADKVTIILGVETRDKSAAVAAVDNAELMNQTIDALLDAGVLIDDIQTTGYSIVSSSRRTDEDAVEEIEFIVSNQVAVELNTTDGTNVGDVLDAAVAAGTNRVVSITFGLQDPRAAMNLALEDAVEDAMSDAAVIASAAGVKLDEILEISEGYTYIPTTGAALFTEYAATPIIAGTVDVTASVSITYMIAQ
jgi:uncharacterized protein YggE